MKGIRGVSFLIAVGSYGGFYVTRERLCLGWIALTYFPYDLENVMNQWLEERNQLRRGIISREN